MSRPSRLPYKLVLVDGGDYWRRKARYTASSHATAASAELALLRALNLLPDENYQLWHNGVCWWARYMPHEKKRAACALVPGATVIPEASYRAMRALRIARGLEVAS